MSERVSSYFVVYWACVHTRVCVFTRRYRNDVTRWPKRFAVTADFAYRAHNIISYYYIYLYAVHTVSYLCNILLYTYVVIITRSVLHVIWKKFTGYVVEISLLFFTDVLHERPRRAIAAGRRFRDEGDTWCRRFLLNKSRPEHVIRMHYELLW